MYISLLSNEKVVSGSLFDLFCAGPLDFVIGVWTVFFAAAVLLRVIVEVRRSRYSPEESYLPGLSLRVVRQL